MSVLAAPGARPTLFPMTKKQPTHEPLFGKAVTYNGRGGPEVIQVVEREVRAPAVNEVRVEVKAAAVNPTDILLRSDSSRPIDRASLTVPGVEAAGIIESVGPGVSRLHLGEKVMLVVVPIPEGVSLAEASTLPMNGLTALRALELAALDKGQSLALSGGAGLLAHYAIAVAKRQGLKVIADAKPAEAGLVRSYGADLVVERGPAFAEAIRRELPAGVDALLDTAVLGERSFAALRDGGVYIPVRGWGSKPAERGIEIKPVFVYEVFERTEWLELLRDMVAAGQIKLRVAGEYTPEQVADAQRALDAGGLRGRPVILF